MNKMTEQFLQDAERLHRELTARSAHANQRAEWLGAAGWDFERSNDLNMPENEKRLDQLLSLADRAQVRSHTLRDQAKAIKRVLDEFEAASDAREGFKRRRRKERVR